MSEKTVFLSYRRPSGAALAHTLRMALTQQGYDVFLDTSSMDAGIWEEQILAQVPKRAHFLLLLTADTLDRCKDPDDWVRREFELADSTGRNVVPVVEDSLDLKVLQERCPDAMRGVFRYQAARVRYDSLDGDVAVLVSRYVPPHKAPAPAKREAAPQRVAVSRLPAKIDRLFGREAELAALDAAWASPETRVFTIVARGGVGKTALVTTWELAVAGLRGAGRFDYLPKGLLTRAWLRSALGDEAGAWADLAEAQEIAERGPMPLFLADIQLYRARLFRNRGALVEARRLVEKHGYLRRLGELEDLEKIAPSLASE